MTEFAIPDDLARHLGEEVDEERATQALVSATALIRNYTRQVLSLVEDDEERHIGRGRSTFFLQQYNPSGSSAFTLEVSEVKLDGEVVAPADYLLFPNVGSLHHEIVWPVRSEIVVTYTHGFDEIPADIIDATLRIATMRFENPQGVHRLAGDDWSLTYPVGTPSGRSVPTPAEMGILGSLDIYKDKRYV